MPRFAPSFAALALVTLAALSAPASAEAQCWGPCVEGGVYIRIGRPYYYPPPRTVIITAPPAPPPPHYIVVQPPPPPPPQYVVVEPPPAQVVVTEPAPAPPPPPVAAPVPAQPAPPQQPAPRRDVRMGVHGSIGGIVAESVSMGGFAGALRLRPSDHFAFDVGVGAYAGEDWNGNQRIEIPVTVDLLAFVNPQRRMQVYFVIGAGASAAFLQDETSWTEDYDRAYTYLGGTGGIGLEWRLARHFALNVDGRAFLRRRIDSTEPEFVDGTRTTNTSAGLLGNLGATLYF